MSGISKVINNKEGYDDGEYVWNRNYSFVFFGNDLFFNYVLVVFC